MQKIRCTGYEDFSAQFSIELPKSFNFAFDILDTIAQATPDRLCIRHVDDDFVQRDISFKDLAASSSRVANMLAAQGIKKGDRVMLVLYRRLEWWECLLGLHKLGAVGIPAPAQLTPHDIEFRIQKAGIKAVIVDESITQRVEEVRSQCPSLQSCIQVGTAALPKGWHDYNTLVTQAEDTFPKPEGTALACDSDPLIVFFSSGTTGMPKMVEHTHLYPLGHLFTGMYWHDLEPGDIHFTVADTGWAKAVWGKAYGQWLAGAAVFVYDYRGKFEGKTLLRVLAEYGVTSFCAPPTVYRFLIREDLQAYDLSKIRHCTTAGELLNASVFDAWKAATKLNLYEGYGQTETTIQIATLPFMEAKPGSIGKPVPGWDVVLLDEDGSICPAGAEGEICVKIAHGSPISLFTCYVDEVEQTKKAKHDGYYYTGDKAYTDHDGYFWFLGRTDDLIKSSGYRIGPFEVESALVAHPAVIEAAVTGVPDAVRGQIVKASIVLAAGYTASDILTKELQEHVKKTTAPYKYPRIVHYLDELPKTISGKIKRIDIRRQDSDAQS